MKWRTKPAPEATNMLIIGGPYDSRYLLRQVRRIGDLITVVDEEHTEHLHVVETVGTMTYIRSQPRQAPPIADHVEITTGEMSKPAVEI